MKTSALTIAGAQRLTNPVTPRHVLYLFNRSLATYPQMAYCQIIEESYENMVIPIFPTRHRRVLGWPVDKLAPIICVALSCLETSISYIVLMRALRKEGGI